MISAERAREFPRTFSLGGLAAMLVGLGMAVFEMRYSFMQERLGLLSRVIVLLCATGFSVWGLKELIAGWWPWLGNRGFGRHRFAWPLEGALYGLIMIVLFVGSLLGRNNPLMLVFSMMAGPFVLNGWVSFTMLRGISARRHVPQRVMAGEPASVELVLENGKSWMSAWMMRVHDQISHRGERLSPDVLFARVPPHGSARGRYQMLLGDRGRYVFGPIQITTRFPLGLVERGLQLADGDEVLVYPRLGRLTSDWRHKLWAGAELSSHRTQHGGAIHDEFHKLREFRSGDDLRAIHWRTSARRNELMIREFREARDRPLAVMLDAWLPPNATQDARGRMELAISFAATVCLDQLRQNPESELTLSAVGQNRFNWSGGGGLHGVELLLDQFALLQGGSGDLADLLRSTAAKAERARLLLITPRPEEAARWQAAWRGDDGQDDLGFGGRLQTLSADPETLAKIFDPH